VTVLGFTARPLSGLPLLSSTVELPIGFIVFNTILRAISLIVSSTGVAVIYYQLRASKEGIGPAELAAVFD
jgi:hypothetical protein